MTSSGRYTYAKEILSKKATKVVSITKSLLSKIDSSAIVIKNKLFDALAKPILLYGCEICYSEHEVSTQQQIRNARFKIKQQLRRHYFQNWLKLRNSTSDNSRQKFTHKEIKKNYQLEQSLTTVRNRISITRLRLGLHSLRIQTGKYENTGASIPVEERKCLVCKENHLEDERHFLMYCKGYDNIRKELYSIISQTDSHFVNLADQDKIMYLLKVENNNTSKNIAKCTYLMFHIGNHMISSAIWDKSARVNFFFFPNRC